MTAIPGLTGRRRQRVLLVATLFLGACAAHTGPAMPPERAILARYAKVTNAAKFATLVGHRVKGTVDMPAAGLSGPMEGYADQAGRVVQIVTFPGIGQMKEGVDTAFAWSLNLIEGPKLIEGKEFAEKREREDPRAARRDPALVLEVHAIGDTTIDGDGCVKLRLGWKSGRQTTECYSRTTGLLLYVDAVESSSMGPIASTTTLGEYKMFEGIMIPTKSVQRAVGTEVTVRITEVVFGPIEPAKLAIPPEIQALRKK